MNTMTSQKQSVSNKSKFLAWLKTFFMWDQAMSDNPPPPPIYRPYSGPGFNRFKTSGKFSYVGSIDARMGSPLTQAEVAGYSEMTKIAMLIFIAIVWFITGWFIVTFAKLFLDHFDLREFRAFLLFFGPMGTAGVYLSILAIPRFVFLIQNFRIRK